MSDVRILYKDEHGAKRDARVDFARVTGALRERAGAAPVGVFIGFLPPAWLGYGANYDDPRPCPPEEHAYDPDAIEVIAYDHQGKAIARETGNNILSLGGRPPAADPPHLVAIQPSRQPRAYRGLDLCRSLAVEISQRWETCQRSLGHWGVRRTS